MTATDVADPPRSAMLTRRELEVLALTADGLPATKIARRLFISERTVNTHKSNVYRKLRATCGAHAVAIAVREGALRLHTSAGNCPLCGCDGTHTTERSA